MKLSVKAMAAACGLLWGGAVLTVAIANYIRPSYGGKFLRTVASVYPGYHGRATPSQVAVGGAYAAVDGAIAGALCAWLYNRFESKRGTQTENALAGSVDALMKVVRRS
jgi:membrane associated rhomboid family serine protease